MKSILDRSFRYTNSVETDLRKTFARIRKEQRAQQQSRAFADAEALVVAQDGEAVVDHMPAFHAHQRGDLVIGGRLSHIRGGRRERCRSGSGLPPPRCDRRCGTSRR